MKLSHNFSLSEFISSATAKANNIDNKPTNQEIESLKQLCENSLQPIRNKIGEPITITSGFRNNELNRLVGGASNSQHRKGQAADIKLRNSSKYGTYHLFSTIVHFLPECYDQLILEFYNPLDKNSGWVHISWVDKIKNRGQILLYEKINGRTNIKTLKYDKKSRMLYEFDKKAALGVLPIEK